MQYTECAMVWNEKRSKAVDCNRGKCGASRSASDRRGVIRTRDDTKQTNTRHHISKYKMWFASPDWRASHNNKVTICRCIPICKKNKQLTPGTMKVFLYEGTKVCPWSESSSYQSMHYEYTGSLGTLRAPTSSWRPSGPLDFVIRALRALRPVRRARWRSIGHFLKMGHFLWK